MIKQTDTGDAQWKERVQTALSDLANTERQKEAWLSGGQIFFPDAVELCVKLVDDSCFPEFLERSVYSKDVHLYRYGRELLEKIESYPDANLSRNARLIL